MASEYQQRITRRAQLKITDHLILPFLFCHQNKFRQNRIIFLFNIISIYFLIRSNSGGQFINNQRDMQPIGNSNGITVTTSSSSMASSSSQGIVFINKKKKMTKTQKLNKMTNLCLEIEPYE